MKKLQRGETIIEVTIAISIIAIALFGLLSLSSHALNQTTVSRSSNVAYAAAQEAIEIVRNNKKGCYNFPTGFVRVVLPAGDRIESTGPGWQDLGVINPSFTGYQRRIRIQEIASGAPVGNQVANNGKVPPGQESKFLFITVTVEHTPTNLNVSYFAILAKGAI